MANYNDSGFLEELSAAHASVGADGTKAWDLVLHSNDPRRPRVTVRIVARPLQLGPCTYSASSLSFGHISAPLPTEPRT